MIRFTQEGARVICDICEGTCDVKTRSKSFVYIRALVRALGWRTCYINKVFGTHDHCPECIKART